MFSGPPRSPVQSGQSILSRESEGRHGQLNREVDTRSKNLGSTGLPDWPTGWEGASALRRDWLFLSPHFTDQSHPTARCHVDRICCCGQPDVRYGKPTHPCGPFSPTTLLLLLLQPDFLANDINTNGKGRWRRTTVLFLWACQERQP